jgi:hypothetical protein
MIESFKLRFGFGFENPCIHYKGQQQHTSSVLECNNLGGNWLCFFWGTSPSTIWSHYPYILCEGENCWSNLTREDSI